MCKIATSAYSAQRSRSNADMATIDVFKLCFTMTHSRIFAELLQSIYNCWVVGIMKVVLNFKAVSSMYTAYTTINRETGRSNVFLILYFFKTVCSMISYGAWIYSFVQKDQGTRLSLILKEDKSNKAFLSWCLTINCLCSYWSIHRDRICEKSSTRLLHKSSKNMQIKKHTTSVLG